MPPARPNESAPIALTAMKPDDVPLQPTGCTPLPVRRWRQGQWHEAQDLVAQERPVALEYNGLSHAVMLATPDDLADFALGFSLTEGLVDRAEQVYGIDINDSPAGITVRIEVASACFARFKDQRRSLAGRTGCGLCGAENLAQAVRQVKPVSSTARFSPQALSRGMGQLRARQPLLSATGATHAAGWCDASGQLQLAREDVGRHNALDKLIGALLRPGQALQAQAGSGFIVVTSRQPPDGPEDRRGRAALAGGRVGRDRAGRAHRRRRRPEPAGLCPWRRFLHLHPCPARDP